MRRFLVRTIALTAAAAAAASCGGSSSKIQSAGADFGTQGGSGARGPGTGATSNLPGASTGGTGGTTGTAPGGSAAGGMGPLPPPPPEIEERRAFEAPRAGARFVFVANPRRDTVAVIDSTTLAIRSVNAGDTPTYLTTLPGKDVAIVLNVDSRDATILRAEGTIARTSTVPVVPGVNALAVSPGGGHVVAWFDSSARGTRAVGGSFQDLSVIALGDGSAGAPDRSMAFTVGFRPTDVRFSSDGSAAFVVTEDGVSIIGLANLRGPGVARLVPVDDPAATTLARDVSVTPNGKFALSRTEASPRIRLVDLETGAVRTLDLGSPVTDLDLSPGGDYAVAVLRQKAAVIRIAIPAGFADDTARTTRLLEAAE